MCDIRKSGERGSTCTTCSNCLYRYDCLEATEEGDEI